MREAIRYPIAWLFGYRGIPYSSRAIFRQEFAHMLFWGVVWGSLNGGFCGYVALRCFDASGFLVSVIGAAVAFANLFAVWWAALIRRQPPRRTMTLALLGTAGVLFSIALTPYCSVLDGAAWPPWLKRWTSQTHALTAVVFATQIALAWVMVQGANTIRTSIWKLNYPDHYRGRILARFALWQILVGATWGIWMGAYLDGALTLRGFNGTVHAAVDLQWLPQAGQSRAYAVVLPVSAVAAILSLILFRRIRIRGGGLSPQTHPANRAGTEVVELNYATPGWFATRWGVLMTGLRDSYRVLHSDRLFSKYMAWMFLSGSGVLLVHVPFVLILEDVFDLNFVQAAGMLTFLPQCMLAVTTPVWARLFDRWTIFKFRSVQIGVWVVSRALLAVGVALTSMPLVLLAVAASGVALGGGRFAWQLGHMGFTNQRNDSIYLGIHQLFTGIRGLIMPFAGTALYLYVLDWHLIWITALMLLIASWGYRNMHRAEQARSRHLRS